MRKRFGYAAFLGVMLVLALLAASQVTGCEPFVRATRDSDQPPPSSPTTHEATVERQATAIKAGVQIGAGVADRAFPGAGALVIAMTTFLGGIAGHLLDKKKFGDSQPPVVAGQIAPTSLPFDWRIFLMRVAYGAVTGGLAGGVAVSRGVL